MRSRDWTWGLKVFGMGLRWGLGIGAFFAVRLEVQEFAYLKPYTPNP